MKEKIDHHKNKRTWMYVLGAVLVVVAIFGLVIAHNNSKDHNKQPTAQNSSNAASDQAKSSKACQIFTLADAKQALGNNAKGGQATRAASSTDIDLSVCIYTQDSGSNTAVSAKKVASLLVRLPKTAAGISSNQNEFSRLRPADALSVEGYGDSAFWDVQLAQLNILKNNTWYIITTGSPVPANRNVDEAKQLADILISKM